MSKCLVTKLDSVFDDDSLTKMGELKVNITVGTREDGNDEDIRFFFVDESVVDVTGGSVRFLIPSSGIDKNGSSVSVPKLTNGGSNTLKIIAQPGTYTIIIKNKYSLEWVWFGAEQAITNTTVNSILGTEWLTSIKGFVFSVKLGAKDLKLPMSLSVVEDWNGDPFSFQVANASQLQGSLYSLKGRVSNLTLNECPNITGDISYLSENRGSTYISIRSNSRITGNIESLGTLTSLGNLNFNGSSGINGTLEGFCQAQINSGRQSGTIQVDLYGTACTYQGFPLAVKTVTFSGGSYTVS